MEFILSIIFFIVLGIIWRLIKLGTKTAYRKATQPKDSLKKVQKEADYLKKDYIITDYEANNIKDSQAIGVCFARLAILVSLSDGEFSKSEYAQILNFFNGAHPSYIDNLIKVIDHDLNHPDSIDWNYNMKCLKEILAKEKFSSFDMIIFDGLLAISSADNKISDSEISTIYNIMSDIGWSAEKVSSFFKSRFGYFEDSSVENDDKINEAYKILDIEKNASFEEIKQKYRTLAKHNHPDLYTNLGLKAQELATDRFQTIQSAYNLILESKD